MFSVTHSFPAYSHRKGTHLVRVLQILRSGQLVKRKNSCLALQRDSVVREVTHQAEDKRTLLYCNTQFSSQKYSANV